MNDNRSTKSHMQFINKDDVLFITHND